MAAVTVPGRSTVATGAAKVLSPATAVVVNTAPGGATKAHPLAPNYSLHDCALPGQVGLHNCVWPINMASKDGVSYVKGVVIHTANNDSLGNFTVTTS